MILILVFSLFSCRSAKKHPDMKKETFALFSKGKCLGNCPVYDITIFTDGSYRYVGVDKVKHKGEKLGTLSIDQLAELKTLLSKDLNKTEAFKRIRDKPITSFIFKEQTHRFYPSKTSPELLEINGWFNKLTASFE